MPCVFKKFETTDVFHNVVEANPEYNFLIYNNEVFLNNEFSDQGSFSNLVNHVPQGFISLHEINVNRPSDSLVSTFLNKNSSRVAFKTISVQNFNNSDLYDFGTQVAQTFPLSASISRIVVPFGDEFVVSTQVENNKEETKLTLPNDNKKYIMALKTKLNDNIRLSTHYAYNQIDTDDAGRNWDKGQQKINMICIPSIFYGSEIKKGSLELNMFVSGTLAATCRDEKSNGELIQTFSKETTEFENDPQASPGSGSVAGVVLYDQGIILLTGSWALDDTHTEAYDGDANSTPTWLNFGSGIPIVGQSVGSANLENSAFQVKFKGVNKIPNITMMAHADKGEFNYSNNFTFVSSSNQATASIGSAVYKESPGKIKNIVKSSYHKHQEEFSNRTYISKVGIYDEDYNLIAIAKLANPVKKTEDRAYTFKLKMDF